MAERTMVADRKSGDTSDFKKWGAYLNMYQHLCAGVCIYDICVHIYTTWVCVKYPYTHACKMFLFRIDVWDTTVVLPLSSHRSGINRLYLILWLSVLIFHFSKNWSLDKVFSSCAVGNIGFAARGPILFLQHYLQKPGCSCSFPLYSVYCCSWNILTAHVDWVEVKLSEKD